MAETKCSFCEMVKKQRSIDELVGYTQSSVLASEYSVNLVIETFENKKKVLGCTSCFEGFTLNFCPECGARMNSRKLIESDNA